MDELLKNLSVNDIEKLKLLFSIIPGYATTTEKTLCKDEITLQVFSSEYKNLIKQTKSASYLRSVKLTLDHFESFFDSNKSINAIRLKDVEDFLTHLQQNVRKGYVVYFRNLKAAFNKAKEWGYVPENFFTKVKLRKGKSLRLHL